MINNKFILGFLLVLSFFIFACTDDLSNSNNLTESNQQNNSSILNDDTNNGINDVDDNNPNVDDDLNNVGAGTDADDDVKVFEVRGGPMFEFFIDGERNADIIVNEGDTVRLEFEVTGNMPHDFVIDELDVASRILQPGQAQVIEFVAQSSGTYEYYCSVGAHRVNGMVGKIIIQ